MTPRDLLQAAAIASVDRDADPTEAQTRALRLIERAAAISAERRFRRGMRRTIREWIEGLEGAGSGSHSSPETTEDTERNS